MVAVVQNGRYQFVYALLQIYCEVPCSPQREHLGSDDYLEDKSEEYHNCTVLYCVLQLCAVICTLISAVLTLELGFCWYRFRFMCFVCF